MPDRNVDYWQNKIAGNVTRDDATNRSLANDGWTVIRFWEHVAAEVAAVEVQAAWGKLRSR